MESNIQQHKRAVIYLRVSSEEQVENFSLETQEEMCQRDAGRKGYEIVQVFREEGRSAKTITGRPVFIRLLEFCRRNRKTIDAVYVYRIDRISRQTADYLAIRKKLAEYGVALISATEPTGNSPTEKLIETMLAGFAQMDNDVRSERSRNGLRARFLSGLCIGRVPIGYVVQDGYAVKDKEMFDKVKKSWNLMSTGSKSLTEMAKIMNEWGIRKVIFGKQYLLRGQTVNDIFRNKFYMGILTSGKYPEEPKGQHIPMITEDLFYRVQSILDGRNRSGVGLKRTHDNPEFPLRRVIKCSRCGTPLTGAWSKGRSGKYGYYFCKSRCGAPSIPVTTLNNSLINFLQEITPTQKCLEFFIFLLRNTYNQNIIALRAKRDRAQLEITELKEKRRILVEKNMAGVYSDEVYQEQNKIIEANIAAAETASNVTLFDKYTIEDISEFMKKKFRDLGETYDSSDLSERRVLLGSIFPSGLHWQYSGYSNREIGALYQSILTVETSHFELSTPCRIRTGDHSAENAGS